MRSPTGRIAQTVIRDQPRTYFHSPEMGATRAADLISGRASEGARPRCPVLRGAQAPKGRIHLCDGTIHRAKPLDDRARLGLAGLGPRAAPMGEGEGQPLATAPSGTTPSVA